MSLRSFRPLFISLTAVATPFIFKFSHLQEDDDLPSSNIKSPQQSLPLAATTISSSSAQTHHNTDDNSAKVNILSPSIVNEIIKKELNKEWIEADQEDDQEVWEQKRTTCPFCRHFLDSPCTKPFKQWSKCVDMAKELELDYVVACSDYTSALLDCSDENRAYFEQTSPVISEDSEIDGENLAESDADENVDSVDTSKGV